MIERGGEGCYAKYHTLSEDMLFLSDMKISEMQNATIPKILCFVKL